MQTLTSRISYIAAVLLLLAALPAEALRVTDVAITSRPTNGDTYRTNETIEVTMTFDKRVRGGRAWLAIGPTSLNVVIGTNTRRFWYDSGDGTTQLVYSYTVQSSDRDTDGISVTSIVLDPAAYITSPLDLNAAERLPDSEYALPRNQIANAGPHKVNRSAATGIFYHAQQGNTERLYRHSGIDYRPATAIAFDGRNRPYMLSYAVYGNEPADNRFLITTLRNGEWTSFSFKDEFIAALGAPSSTLPVNDRYSEMVIDQHDDLYAVLTWVSVRPAGSSRDDTTFALLYAKNVASSSFNGDFQVLEMPGKLMLETRMSANDFANYPPLVGWTEGHSVSDPTYPYPQRVSWAFAAWHKFYVLPLRRDANGNVAGMTLADSIRVDNKLGYVTSHSGGQSFAVTRGDTSFIAYMRHEGETNTYGNNTVYARAFYRKNHQVGVGDTLSARKRLFLSHPDFADAHSTPVIAIDLDGYIHVLGGAHGGPFAYRKSSHPMDITSWDDVANVGSGRTYSSLVIDNLSQMFSTFRTPSPYKLFFQDGTTTTGFVGPADSNGTLFADQNCGHAYRVYYHSQHKDRPRPGTNERIYVNWTANCEANLDHWDGYRILAYTDDRGATFQLPTKADFTSRVERLDTSPESFSFTERTGVQPGSSVTSDTITVRGINSVVPIEATGGTLVVNGQDFTGTTVARGQKVAVKVTASSNYNTTTATVTIGGVSANFSVRPSTDYEADDDGLIEVRSLAQLHAMRWDLNGDGQVDSGVATADAAAYRAAFSNSATGADCPTNGCTGYELDANLTFDTNGDGRVDADDGTYAWGGGLGWLPIGTFNAPFNATFQGNGKTLSHLFANRYINYSGLFGVLGSSARVEALGLPHAYVATGQGSVGALAGRNAGTVAASYATGRVMANTNVGGLVGANAGTLTASYSTAAVSCNYTNPQAAGGGLVGWNDGSITASYAIGTVAGTCANLGGLAGSGGGTAVVTVSFWDTETSGIADAVPSTSLGTGYTQSVLRTPISAAGIYAEWDDLTVDASGTDDDDPWTFGTTVQYPVLRFQRTAAEQTAQFASQPLSKVTGVSVVGELGQLAVSWTAVSGADGYKVQWKSGDEAYDDARQITIKSGTTATIQKLTAGVAYTVRVVATRTIAGATDEGPPSAEATGTPRRNGEPTAEAGDNQTVDEGDAVTLSGSGTHPEKKPLTYSWRQTGGTTVTLSSASVATPTFTAPNLLATEDLTFELTVSDGTLSATDTVTITVTADNDAPTAEAGGNQTVDEGDAVTLSGSGTDPEEQTLTYSWRQTTSAPTVSLTGATTKTPSFTSPNVAENTPLTFELTVSDGTLSTTDTVTITVTGDNDAPTANAGTNTTGTQETSVTLEGSGTDPEGQTLTYSWRQTAGSPTVSLTGTTTKTPSFIAPKVAENTPLTFELTVSDGTLSATDTVTITVSPSAVITDKDAPTAKAGTDKTVDEGDEVTLSGSGTHPEDQPLTYSWRQTSGTTVTLSSASVATSTFTAPNLLATEALTFELTVSAGRLSTTDTVTITVTADNDAPTAVAGDNQLVDEGDAVTLSGSGTDPEEQTLTYSWRQTSSGTTVALSSASVATPTFTAPNLLATEDLTFELTVSDGTLSATDTVTITVTADNDAPTADAGTNKTVDAGATVTLSGSGTDPEEQPLTYSWRQTSSGTTVALSSTSVAAPTFTAPALREAEDLTFELTVSDGTLSATATVTITVNAADTTPDAFSFTEQTEAEPGADVTSDAITVSGIEAAAAISVDGGSLVVDGSTFSGATVTNGQTVAVKTTASSSFSTATTATVTIGGVSANFEVTTRAADTTPEAFTFTEQTEAEPGADVTSDAITVSGIEAAVPIAVDGGSLVVDGSAFSGATVTNGQTVAVKATASSSFSTATTAKVTIGGVSTNFKVTTRAADTTPEAFTFTEQTEAEPGAEVTSAAITVSGIEAAVSISVDGGSLVVDGSDFTDKTVSNGQKVAVKVTASSLFSTATTATVTIGGVSANFKVTTRAADTTPKAFAFTEQTEAEPGADVTSDAITVSGIEAAVSIAVTGGSLVVDGSTFSGATVSNGQTVAVKATASSSFSTATTAKVTIGGVSANFEVTTRAADTTPEAFAFTEQTEVEPGSSVTSDAITVSGIEAAVSIAVTGGSLVVDGSTFSGTTVSNGQKVAVKVTASSLFSTATTATVTIGGVSTNFKVTTRAADTTPEAFTFTDQTEAEPGSSVTSNAITVSGIEAAVPIAVTGGSLVVDGSDFSGATVSNGQTVAVKVTASSSFSTATTATVTIGGVSAHFKVTTKEVEIEPPTTTATAGFLRVRLDWTPVASATGYDAQVQGKPFDGGTWPTAWTSAATDMAGRKVGARRRYMHTGLSPDSLYRYQVRSRIGAAVSAWSALTPDAAGIQPLVGAPTGFKAEAGAGQVTLLWTGPHHKSITKWRYRDATALGDETKGGWQDIEVSVNAGEYSAAVPDLTPGQAYRFQVRAVNGAGGGKPSAVSDEVVVAAVSKLTTQPIHRLAVQARPNPFNPRTTLQLALPTPETVSLSIYNLYGQRVRVLLNAESLPAGYATVAWDSRDDHGVPVASGLYLYRLQTTTEVVVGKMALIR